MPIHTPSFLQHCAGVNALALSDDCTQLFTASRDATVKRCAAALLCCTTTIAEPVRLRHDSSLLPVTCISSLRMSAASLPSSELSALLAVYSMLHSQIANASHTVEDF